MIRWLFFALLGASAVGYAFWIYLRVELSVGSARALAVVRSAALLVVLFLLFDPQIPTDVAGRDTSRWVLLDVSLSMTAGMDTGSDAWSAASARAEELEGQGWNLVPFGAGRTAPGDETIDVPDRVGSSIAPVLSAAAEAGAREVTVLSDLRFDDRVALRAALETLPIEISFEAFGETVANAGIASFEVPDVLRPDVAPEARIEVFGGESGDSVVVEILQEDEVVETVAVAAPTPGLRAASTVTLPPPDASGRVRYTARVVADTDAFPEDDEAVDYANIGYEEGALVLVSMDPDWEPRFLLPVLAEVTGLPATGYLRAGPDRYVALGRAIDRGGPTDSATVRRAASEAAVLVVHGLGGDDEAWLTALVERSGRRLLLPRDPLGAAVLGVDVSAPRPGEWYASPDLPMSPIAGALSGIVLQGLPPLSDVMVAATRSSDAPLHAQLRGAGAAESVFELVDRPEGRSVVALASGFWRWAMREPGREPYRRLWSGVVGWLLADQEVAASEPRPIRWVFDRDAPVAWNLPDGGVARRIVVENDAGVVVDTTVQTGGRIATGPLPPGPYRYGVLGAEADTLASGRFDVTASNAEMLPVAEAPPEREARTGGGSTGRSSRPLRTSPWPYLLVIGLLCGEWVVRRRSGLR